MSVKEKIGEILKPTEATMALGGLFLIISVITVFTMYRNGNGVFQPDINYENMSPVQKQRLERIESAQLLGEDEKNVRYAERIRDASSIGLGLSIFILEQRISNNRVFDLPNLMREFSRSELLPPGATVLIPDNNTAESGIIQTNRGYYLIRYRAKPLLLEILSASGSGLTDGNIFILRLPDTTASNIKIDVNSNQVSSAGAWASLYEAPENPNHAIPPAFADVKVFQAMNWRVRPLLQTEMSSDKVRELYKYLEGEKKK